MAMTDHRGGSLFLINYATQIISLVVVTPFVFLRVWVRWKVNHALGIDDGMIQRSELSVKWLTSLACCFLGWLLFMGYCSSALAYGFAGGTKPPAQLDDDRFETCVKISYVATILYSPAALCVKTSLLYILIRIFHPLAHGATALHCLIVMVICYYITITFVKVFMCNPIKAYWSESEREHGHCLSQPGVIIADSLISFVTDVAILAFPVVFTWTLQMPIWKKIKIVALLGLGGVAVAFSLYRLVIGIHESKTPHDTTMFMKSILTGNAELGLGLICACLPALNILATYTEKRRVCSPRRSSGGPKKGIQHPPHIFDWPQAHDQDHLFPRTEVSTCARRASSDSIRLMAHWERGGPSISENSDIIRMVSLSQHWEHRSDRSEAA